MKNRAQNKKTESLIGLSKKEVVERLGDDFNFYPAKEWIYTLKKYWWGQSKKLYLEFDKEDKVIRQYTKRSYEK
ncbi:MAG: hypothetical protein QM564_02895 [Bergeyella sp.]